MQSFLLPQVGVISTGQQWDFKMPRYAHIHLNSTEPKRSKGWYDTDLLHYPNLPPKEELRVMSDEEWGNRHINDHHYNDEFVKKPEPTNEEIAETVKRSAKVRHTASNEKVLQFYEEAVPVPEDWKDYRSSLRAIINGNGSLVLPEPPKS